MVYFQREEINGKKKNKQKGYKGDAEKQKDTTPAQSLLEKKVETMKGLSTGAGLIAIAITILIIFLVYGLQQGWFKLV